jgi:hypothetical protein
MYRNVDYFIPSDSFTSTRCKVSHAAGLETSLYVMYAHSRPLVLPRSISASSTLAVIFELVYLKSLVGQLTDKINEFEAKVASKLPTPAQQLRTILIGPPGAGTSTLRVIFFSPFLLSSLENFVL